jgi:hypothetical protein
LKAPAALSRFKVQGLGFKVARNSKPPKSQKTNSAFQFSNRHPEKRQPPYRVIPKALPQFHAEGLFPLQAERLGPV